MANSKNDKTPRKGQSPSAKGSNKTQTGNTSSTGQGSTGRTKGNSGKHSGGSGNANLKARKDRFLAEALGLIGSFGTGELKGLHSLIVGALRARGQPTCEGGPTKPQPQPSTQSGQGKRKARSPGPAGTSKKSKVADAPVVPSPTVPAGASDCPYARFKKLALAELVKLGQNGEFPTMSYPLRWLNGLITREHWDAKEKSLHFIVRGALVLHRVYKVQLCLANDKLKTLIVQFGNPDGLPEIPDRKNFSTDEEFKRVRLAYRNALKALAIDDKTSGRDKNGQTAAQILWEAYAKKEASEYQLYEFVHDLRKEVQDRLNNTAKRFVWIRAVWVRRSKKLVFYDHDNMHQDAVDMRNFVPQYNARLALFWAKGKPPGGYSSPAVEEKDPNPDLFDGGFPSSGSGSGTSVPPSGNPPSDPSGGSGSKAKGKKKKGTSSKGKAHATLSSESLNSMDTTSSGGTLGQSPGSPIGIEDSVRRMRLRTTSRSPVKHTNPLERGGTLDESGPKRAKLNVGFASPIRPT
jgi:hypothetical protein